MAASTALLHALEAITAGATADEVENETLEFKTEVARSRDDTLRKLAEAVACLANGQGGSVIAGVRDNVAGKAAFVGCTLEPALVKRRVFELTEPGLVVDVDQLVHQGVLLLVLSTPASPAVHAVAGRVTERVGSSCAPMTTARIATVLADRRADDWSARDSGLDWQRVDPRALITARELLAESPDPARQAHSDRSDVDLLRRLGLITPHHTLTNAGALLFTSEDQAEQLAYVFRRTPSGTLVVNERVTAPLLVALQRVFDLITARLDRTSVNIRGGQQLQLADLPDVAVREAVVNAVMHRSYRHAGAIVIEHAPTRFAVTSPGPFLSGVGPDNVLTTSSRTRNPGLATAVRSLGLAETAGTGVDRMYAEMARVGHQPPSYEAGPEHVRVTLLGGAPNAHLARYTATLPREESRDADTMLVLLTLLSRRTVSAVAMAPLLQRPEAEAQSVLDRLAAPPAELLERTRETAGRARPNYRLRGPVIAALGPAVTYRRLTTDEYDRKIVALVQESGEVNARLVRVLLDLDASAASRVLSGLVERGLLVKSSASQRGPGVTYGPGPSFPRRR